MSSSRVQIFGLDYEDVWDLYRTLVNSQGKDLLWERSRAHYVELLGEALFKFEEVPRAGSRYDR